MKTPFDFKNFKKGPLTSFLGMALIGVGIYVYLTKGEDGEMFAYTLIGIGAMAFGLKDPKLPGKRGAAMLALIGSVLLSSCVTYKRCADKYGNSDAVHTITVRDTVPVQDTLYLMPEELEGSTAIQDILQGETFTDTSDSGNLEIKFWFDKYNNLLHYKASQKPDTIRRTIYVPVEVKGDCPDTVTLDKDKGASGIARFWESFKSFSVWALFILLAIGFMLYKWMDMVQREREITRNKEGGFEG